MFAEIGAGITMGPNAITCLGEIDPRLRVAFDKCATYNETEEFKYAFMAVRHGMEKETGGLKYVEYTFFHDVGF